MSEDKKKKYTELQEALKSGKGPKATRFALAVLSGLVPGVGGILGGVSGAWSEKEQEKINNLVSAWLKLQEEEIKEIGNTIIEVMIRLDSTDEKIQRRIESSEYLSIIKKCFRDWSAAESEYKRILIRNLLVSVASTEICNDDIIRLFIEWIDRYSEQHFKVISAIYNDSGITRERIWDKIDGEDIREDSAKADLFRLIIHELSIGRVIRQYRETDYQGNFLKNKRSSRNHNSRTMTSAFDDNKEYELTELGKWLVHYTINEIVPKINAGTKNE